MTEAIDKDRISRVAEIAQSLPTEPDRLVRRRGRAICRRFVEDLRNQTFSRYKEPPTTGTFPLINDKETVAYLRGEWVDHSDHTRGVNNMVILPTEQGSVDITLRIRGSRIFTEVDLKQKAV